MAVQRVVKRADDAVDVDQAIGHLLHLFRRQDRGVEAHVAVLGAFGLQLVKPGLIVGQGDAADMVQPAGHAGDLFQLLVQADGVALQGGHVGVAVDGVKAARRVPGGAGGQFRPLDQHHIGPAELGQVIQNRAADDAATDDHNAGMGFHIPPLYGFVWSGYQAIAQRPVRRRHQRSPLPDSGAVGAKSESGGDRMIAAASRFRRAGSATFRASSPLGLNRSTTSSATPRVSRRSCGPRSIRWSRSGAGCHGGGQAPMQQAGRHCRRSATASRPATRPEPSPSCCPTRRRSP